MSIQDHLLSYCFRYKSQLSKRKINRVIDYRNNYLNFPIYSRLPRDHQCNSYPYPVKVETLFARNHLKNLLTCRVVIHTSEFFVRNWKTMNYNIKYMRGFYSCQVRNFFPSFPHWISANNHLSHSYSQVPLYLDHYKQKAFH